MLNTRPKAAVLNKVFNTAAFGRRSSDQVQKGCGATLARRDDSRLNSGINRCPAAGRERQLYSSCRHSHCYLPPGTSDGGQPDRSVVRETCRSDTLACSVLSRQANAVSSSHCKRTNGSNIAKIQAWFYSFRQCRHQAARGGLASPQTASASHKWPKHTHACTISHMRRARHVGTQKPLDQQLPFSVKTKWA